MVNIIKKLSFQARGPFQIVKILEGNSYLVKRYNSDQSTTRKYKGSELYLLPPSIFPHDPVDTMDQRYLNFSNSLVVSPFKKPLQIELYNDTYFPSKSKHINKPSLDQPSCQIDSLAFTPYSSNKIPPSSTLFEESNIKQPDIETEELDDYTKPCFTASEYNNLDNSLFFVTYVPEGTIKRKWYLIQIDMESTRDTNPEYASNGQFWCVFLAKLI